MTEQRKYPVAGAELTVTFSLEPNAIHLQMLLDLSALDADTELRGPNGLANYLDKYLDKWNTPKSYWWVHRCKHAGSVTGTQAKQAVRATIDELEGAINAALLDRQRRLAEMAIAVA